MLDRTDDPSANLDNRPLPTQKLPGMKFVFTFTTRPAFLMSPAFAGGSGSRSDGSVRSALQGGSSLSAAIRYARIDRFGDVIYSTESIAPS